MNWEQVINYAIDGYTFILPGWKGYFKYNYRTNELIFNNNDYYLNQQQLLDMGINKRTDWIKII